MNTYRKPLFWGLILLLVILVICACCLGVYTIFLQPILSQLDFSNPNIMNNYPSVSSSSEFYTPVAGNIQATVTALQIDENKYFKQRDAEKTIAVMEKIIALDPKNPAHYFDEAYIYRHLSDGKTNLNDYMDLLQKGLDAANKGITLDPQMGDLYIQRSFLLTTLANGYTYRADREYLNKLALEDLKKGISLGNNVSGVEKDLVAYNVSMQECDTALPEAVRQATAEPQYSIKQPSATSLLESVYECKGDYQKAYDYHMLNLKRFNITDKDCGCEGETAMYLYMLGRPDEAYNLVNQALIEKPNYYGSRYFIRAAIEFDRGDYDKAMEDADRAEGSSWAFGAFSSYIEGLNAERLGNTQEAITKLQYAEATMDINYMFAARRARVELEKMGAAPLVVALSVPPSLIPIIDIPTDYPTPDVLMFPILTLTPSAK